MASRFRTAPWLLIGIVIVALWAWSTLVATPPPSVIPPAATSTDDALRPSESAPAPGRSGDGARRRSRADSAPLDATPAWLPPEARDTLQLIARGGPFPHRQDGSTFGNRERQLPHQTHGWYREYTVDTPGSRDRGARRVIAGGQPPIDFFYTDDHYRSFRRVSTAGMPR